MPWCPKCKNEYREGITVCADCGTELVDELPPEDDSKALAFISDEELAGKLVKYLEFSSIPATVDYDDDNESFCVKVEPDRLDEAKKAFRAFYQVEKSNEAQKDLLAKLESILPAGTLSGEDAASGEAWADNTEDDENGDEDPDTRDITAALESINLDNLTDEEKQLLSQALVSEQVYKPAEVYVTKSDESKDMFSTAITFLAFAVGLSVFLVLNLTNVVTLFNNTASIIVMGVLAVGCCLVGINAIKRSRRAEIASHDEEKLTADIKQWLEENINDEFFASLDNEELTTELLYLKRTDMIRTELNKAYPGLNEDYVDALIDDFYDSYFPEEQ